MSAPTDVLHSILMAAAYALLARLANRRGADGPERATATSAQHRVTILLQPVGDAEPAEWRGRWLSPLETLIVERIAAAKRTAPGKPILGKNIATLVGRNYDPPFKMIV